RSTEANGAAVAEETTRATTVTYPNPPSLPPGSELPTFDLLVVYTPAARDGAGGDDAVQALAELAIADANQCYANSGINVRGRLVGVTPVDYQESGSIRADVDALATTDDGILDEVHPLRDQLAADFVCLFTNRASVDGYNGYALIMQQLQPDWEETAFSAINVGSVLVDHLFAHEIGHNMGCDHDRQNTTGYHLFPFSEGWRFHGRDGLLYRDVMAYPPGVSTPNFSNPRVAYLGARTGSTNAADNVRTINASAPFFVDFRSPDGLGRVSVAASVPATSVKKPQLPGQFTIARSGAVNAPLEVFYQVGGSAVGGVDYATLPASVTIAAGEHSATLDVTLLSPPPAAYASKTVTLEILPMDGYALGNSPQALVTLEGARYRPTGR
ncbi:MAG: hypothetical protein JO117_08795, partial [Verrucomicrobia bacterium]|nr:hypothetical protein [Verrucomicrobiota bacterium]